jgi:hypothetical protein
MFKKLISIGTSLFIAAGLTIAGVALPAAADYSDGTQPTSDSVTPPAPLAAPVAAAAPAACDPYAKFTYTYFPSAGAGHTANSGTVTITGNGDPCTPLFVTAASWTFDGPTASPQHISQLNKYTFDKLGTFPFSAPVNCGQGDIYASWDGYVVPPIADNGVLHPPASWEQGHFLHDVLAGAGPNPTYVVQTSDGTLNGMALCVIQPALPVASVITNCMYLGSLALPANTASVHYQLTNGNGTSGLNTVTATAQPGYLFPFTLSPDWTLVTTGHVWTKTFDLGQFPSNCALAGDPLHSDQMCVSGALVPATITVALTTGLKYTITGPATGGGNGPTVTVTTAVTTVAPGTYIVSVSALAGFTLTGAGAWPITIVILPPVNCVLWDATANVATIPGTCDFAGSINAIATSIVNATWRDATTHVALASLPHVAGTTYTVEAVATAGHAFAGGLLIKPITYTIQPLMTGPDCDETTLPAAEVNAYATNQGCSVGRVTTGSVSVVFPLAQEADVLYTLDGTTPIPFGAADLVTLAVSPGVHTVTATPNGPDGIFAAVGSVGVQNPTTGVVTFSFTVTRFIGTCGDLKTLAFTGRDLDVAGISLAGGGVGLVGIGIVFVFLRRNYGSASK